jgi:hypothetical protein
VTYRPWEVGDLCGVYDASGVLLRAVRVTSVSEGVARASDGLDYLPSGRSLTCRGQTLALLTQVQVESHNARLGRAAVTATLSALSADEVLAQLSDEEIRALTQAAHSAFDAAVGRLATRLPGAARKRASDLRQLLDNLAARRL